MSADLEREELAEVAREVACEKVGQCFTQGTDVMLIARAVKAAKYAYLAAATLREEEIEGQRHFFNLATEEIATLRARVAELEMVVANYPPVCIGDCGCEGSLAGCAILGDDPEASAIAESVAAKMVPPPETKP